MSSKHKVTFPESLYVSGVQDFRFDDSGIQIDDASILVDSDPTKGDTNEVAAVYAGEDGDDSEAFAAELARRWNAHGGLLAFLHRVSEESANLTGWAAEIGEAAWALIKSTEAKGS